MALAAPVTGEAIERYAYHPYGRVTILDGGTFSERIASFFDTPYRFTSGRLDPETGLYYYRARYYHPTLGRFLTRDPLGYVDGPGLYEYVGGGWACGRKACTCQDGIAGFLCRAWQSRPDREHTDGPSPGLGPRGCGRVWR